MLAAIVTLALLGSLAVAQQKGKGRRAEPELTFPPKLPDGKQLVADRTADFLQPPAGIKSDVAVARTPPTVEFLFYPGQDYPGKPWSNWGDSLAVGGKYFSTIGDHLAIGQRSDDAAIWSFNCKTEETRRIGSAAVGSQAYVASIDADPTGRYLYYVPGAHGGSERDGTAVVQFDVKTGRKKVIAFLEPFYTKRYGFTLKGTYATAIDPAGDKLYVTWNVSRGGRAWDCCGMTVIHIPESERITE